MSAKLAVKVIAIAALGLSSGCAGLAAAGASGIATGTSSAASNVVTTPSSMFDYTAGSTEVAFMSPAALLTEHSRIEESIIHEQCYFKTPDPLFFVAAGQQGTWSFAGRLDPDRHFRALEYRSILTLGLMDSNSQLNTWPLELVSLADMPQAFLAERLPTVAQAKLPSNDGEELVQNYLEQAQHIQGVVARLETRFNPAVECNGRTASRY